MTKLIFPLDFSNINDATEYVKLLKGEIDIFKVGLELFLHEGPEVLREIKKWGAKSIFLDLKLHDIPNTVGKALKGLDLEGIEFITVHTCDGPSIIEAAVNNVPSHVKILGVTLLTSVGKEEVHETLLVREDITPSDIVLHRAGMAKRAGCAGVVCSGEEIDLVRSRFPGNFLIVVPGIRPLWYGIRRDDQRRIITPAEATLKGADFIVVGRPIRLAPDPLEAARKILLEIKEAHQKK